MIARGMGGIVGMLAEVEGVIGRGNKGMGNTKIQKECCIGNGKKDNVFG